MLWLIFYSSFKSLRTQSRWDIFCLHLHCLFLLNTVQSLTEMKDHYHHHLHHHHPHPPYHHLFIVIIYSNGFWQIKIKVMVGGYKAMSKPHLEQQIRLWHNTTYFTKRSEDQSLRSYPLSLIQRCCSSMSPILSYIIIFSFYYILFKCLQAYPILPYPYYLYRETILTLNTSIPIAIFFFFCLLHNKALQNSCQYSIFNSTFLIVSWTHYIYPLFLLLHWNSSSKGQKKSPDR